MKWNIEEKKLKSIILVLGGGAILALFLQMLLSFVVSPQIKKEVANSEEMKNRQQASILNAAAFEEANLEAHAVYVFDLKTKEVLFAKNEQEKLPLASVTKIMTTFLARERVSRDAILVLSKDDLAAEGDSGLRTGERWRLEDLLNLMLIISSNDAAHAIAGFVGGGSQGIERGTPEARTRFIAMMNEEAHTLNLTQMEFFNESGLDINATKNGGYGSARDVAILFAKLWEKYPETVEITTHKATRVISQNDIVHILPNTDEITGQIPGLIASKTGYTTLAGGNLAVIFDRGVGDPVVAVVLGSTYKGRFDDMQKIVRMVRGNAQ